MTQTFTLKPSYERKILSGRLGIGAFLGIIIVAEVVIYWGLSSGRNSQEYSGAAVLFLLMIPVFAYFFVLSARGGKEKLAPFINSTSSMIKSWACVGPLPETGGYEADCELSNGCIVQCIFGVLGRSERKGGVLRVFRFIKGPETVNAAPLFKGRIDKKTLKTTKFPVKDDALDSWRNSETSWKRLVSMDESIRSWIAAHFAWNTFEIKQPSPGDVFRGFVLCHDLYLRSPTRKGEWLKGKTLGVFLNFIEPTDQQEIKDFYSWTITVADKILQYVVEATNLSSGNEKTRSL